MALLVRTLDHDARYAGLLELFRKVFTDLDVFLKQAPEFLLARVPTRVPGSVDTQAQANRIDFLSHYAGSFSAFLAAGLFAGLPAVFADAFLDLAFGSVSAGFSSRFSSTTIVICAKGL